MDVYVLRLDNYSEWAWENGASNLLAVSSSLDKVLNELKSYLEHDATNDFIIGDYESVDTVIQDFKDTKYFDTDSVDIYTSNTDYDNGCNMGTYVIERTKLL